jgi:glutamate--cysteine ligase
MQTPCQEYEDIGLKRHGKYQQLNTNILQIENEYYASVRPKPLVDESKQPLDALHDNGIGYIELRSIDINPLTPLGIDQEQVLFLETYILFCLLEPSPIISSREQFEIDNNDQLVAHEGRKPGLLLTKKGQQCTLQEWGQILVDDIERCAQLLSTEHQQAVVSIARRIKNPDLTPSAITLNQMKNRNQGFFDYINVFAKQYRRTFLSNKVDTRHFDYLDKQTTSSCAEQLKIEQADNLRFDEFLAKYFKDS